MRGIPPDSLKRDIPSILDAAASEVKLNCERTEVQ